MKQISAIFTAIILIGGCAKQNTDLVTPDQVSNPDLAVEQGRLELEKQPDLNLPETDDQRNESDPASSAMTGDTGSTAANKTQSKTGGRSKTMNATKPVSSPSLSSNTVSSRVTAPAATGNTAGELTPEGKDEAISGNIPAPLLDQPRKMEYSHEVLFPDSAWDKYMIRKGDFLIKIAKKEYDDWTMWRDIYQWNRETIGDDPNKIYPYHWLDLLKPYDEVEACKLTFFPRKTREGESLWTIAREVYGDEYAWIILYWDNEELLESSDGVLYPGLRLQIRENIDPCDSKS
ncbi:MAG: LysM peptidoglycan-binding domain-containing protein [Fidelibacterota bacterium]